MNTCSGSQIASIAAVAKALKLSIPTVTVALNHLVRIGIVEEVTGKQRDRIFTYSRYFNIVSEGTGPASLSILSFCIRPQ